MGRGFDDSWRDFKPQERARTCAPSPASPAPAPKKRHKYSAQPVVVDGIRFDSTKEAEHWQVLQLREKAGEIHGLARQRPFVLSTISKRDGLEHPIGKLVVDFVYWEGEQLCVEDVKSPATREIPLYQWKRRHFEAQYGIQIREV